MADMARLIEPVIPALRRYARTFVRGAADADDLVQDTPWPIRNGHNYQPTEHELRGLHQEDVTPDQAREIDRLYDQLLASSEQVRNRHSAPKH